MRRVRWGAGSGVSSGGSRSLGLSYCRTLLSSGITPGFRAPGSSSPCRRSKRFTGWCWRFGRGSRDGGLARWLESRLHDGRRAGIVTTAIRDVFLGRRRPSLQFRSSGRCSSGWGRPSSRNRRLGLEGTRAFLQHRTHPAIRSLASVTQASQCICYGRLPRHCSQASTRREVEASKPSWGGRWQSQGRQ